MKGRRRRSTPRKEIQMTVKILANEQEPARNAILEAFALNEDQLAPQGAEA